ncbi:uncharacterized protein LOC111129867 [Crassostrea virginica]|uniref:Uncharacterized protein LOC111129867 n=1 Tax=Crassostrea virginica TaxID=6565 RepID=A0A8B8DV15_CRAVI|nr:uncharacterized protein LOC111129867 [Crassostrea virginica]
MNSNSPAQFVPSTPRFRCVPDEARICSTPVAVVPDTHLSFDRSTDSTDAAVPRTPVADPVSTRTPHSFRFSALLRTPVSRYTRDKHDNRDDQKVPSTPKSNNAPVFSTPTVPHPGCPNVRRAARLQAPRRQPRRLLPPNLTQGQDPHTLNLFSGDSIFS